MIRLRPAEPLKTRAFVIRAPAQSGVELKNDGFDSLLSLRCFSEARRGPLVGLKVTKKKKKSRQNEPEARHVSEWTGGIAAPVI